LLEKLEILTTSPKREWLVLIGVSVVIFIIQMLTLRPVVGIGEPYFIAKNMAAGYGYSYPFPFDTVAEVTCYIPPLYVYFHFLIMKLGGGIIVSQIAGLFFFHLANIVIYRFFKNHTSTGNALAGFFLFAIYLPLWLTSQKPDPDGLNVLLIALTISLLYKVSKIPSRKSWVWLGLLFGVQLLLRPDIMLGMVMFGLWLLWFSNKSETRKGYLQSILVAIVLVLPWTLRNYVVFDRFIFVSANSGFNFYMGNNPNATGEFVQDVTTPGGKAQVDSITTFFDGHPSHAEADSYLMKIGKAWVLDNPGDALILAGKKFIYHWWHREYAGSDIAGEEWMIVGYRVASIFLIIFGFIGLFSLREKKVRALILTLFLYSTAISVIFFVQSRHRALKVDPFLIPLSVIGLSQVTGKLIQHKKNT
jgi:hypothetical protein